MQILVTQFNGTSDAGGVARLAVEGVLRSLLTERAATFDMDVFLDYEPYRSFVTASDWVLESVEIPGLILDRVKDDLGNPVLVPHDTEPGAEWESFSRIVTELAIQADVEVVVFFDGMPSEVPHTRPTPVHIQTTEKTLIPEQP